MKTKMFFVAALALACAFTACKPTEEPKTQDDTQKCWKISSADGSMVNYFWGTEDAVKAEIAQYDSVEVSYEVYADATDKFACEDMNGGGSDNYPTFDGDQAGTVRLCIHIPAGSECNGIAFKGTYNGNDWSGADTYLGADFNQAAGPNECIRFQAVEGWDNWYVAEYQVMEDAFSDVNYLAGKVCLIYAGDGSWEGQAKEWNFMEDYCTVATSISGDGNVQINGRVGTAYIEVGSWNKSECVEVTKLQYHVTVIVPSCDEVVPEIIGGFDSWSGTAMTKVRDYTYEATIQAAVGEEYKFRAQGTWENQIQVYNVETGEWVDGSNMSLGEETEVAIDFSDNTMYKWTSCVVE
mgnify:CR=1 FL=1